MIGNGMTSYHVIEGIVIPRTNLFRLLYNLLYVVYNVKDIVHELDILGNSIYNLEYNMIHLEWLNELIDGIEFVLT